VGNFPAEQKLKMILNDWRGGGYKIREIQF